MESAVNNLYVYARIENDTFYELADINSRIWELLDEYCSLPYKGSSRWEIFEKYELANILRNNRDKAAVNTIISTTPQNDNVRGASAYRGIVSSKDRQES